MSSTPRDLVPTSTPRESRTTDHRQGEAAIPPSPLVATHMAETGDLAGHAAAAGSRLRTFIRASAPLRRSDGGYVPFAGHAFELVSAAIFEFES